MPHLELQGAACAGWRGWGVGVGGVCWECMKPQNTQGVSSGPTSHEDLRTKHGFNIKTVIIREWKCGIQANLKVTQKTSKKCACGQVFGRHPDPQESMFILLSWEGYLGIKV